MQMHKDDEEAKGIAGVDAMEGEWVAKKEVKTSKTPYVAIDERGLVRSIHSFVFSCVH